jgi:hypothetical protein
MSASSIAYPGKVVIDEIHGIAELSDSGSDLEDRISDSLGLEGSLEVLHGFAQSHDCRISTNAYACQYVLHLSPMKSSSLSFHAVNAAYLYGWYPKQT